MMLQIRGHAPVVVDPLFNPASLHEGRLTMKQATCMLDMEPGETTDTVIDAVRRRRQRLVNRDPSNSRWWRCQGWPLVAQVREAGDVVLTVWPTDGQGGPRAWANGGEAALYKALIEVEMAAVIARRVDQAVLVVVGNGQRSS